MKLIAETHVIFVAPTGERWEGIVAIGEPERVPTGEWGCRVHADRIHDRVGPVLGETALQVIVLAMKLLAFLLADFAHKGGHFIDPLDGSDFAMSSVFGPAWPGSPQRPTSASSA